MGDTFTDSWVDQIPNQWGNWRCIGQENTKWEGNLYIFAHREEKPQDSYFRITLRSVDPKKIRLRGEVLYQQGPVRIHLESATWRSQANVEWDSIEVALQALDQKFFQVKELAKPLEILTTDKKWESRDPLA